VIIPRAGVSACASVLCYPASFYRAAILHHNAIEQDEILRKSAFSITRHTRKNPFQSLGYTFLSNKQAQADLKANVPNSPLFGPKL
jgi:hypothetical protein